LSEATSLGWKGSSMLLLLLLLLLQTEENQSPSPLFMQFLKTCYCWDSLKMNFDFSFQTQLFVSNNFIFESILNRPAIKELENSHNFNSHFSNVRVKRTSL
jgi:hypothetical protein